MSVGTLPEQGVGSEFDHLLTENPAVVELARRLIAGASGRQASPYRRQLLERLRQRDQKNLPPFQYQSYRLTGGKHTHSTREAVAAAAALNKGRSQNDYVNPEERTFSPGDIITPQSDGEALMMDQDPMKFQPVGAMPEVGQPDAAALLAEINRLRANDADKDRRIAELEEQAKKNKK